MTKPTANVLNLSLDQRAKMALKAGVGRVIVEHVTPDVDGQALPSGKVVEIPPYELRAQTAVLEASSS